MRWWYWGWFSGYSAITMGRLGMWALADTPADRAENAVGAATSFLGVGGLVISPLRKHLSDGKDLRAHTATSPAEWAGKRAAAETLLRTQAAAQRRGKHWGNRMLSASVPIGAGLVLWLAYDLPVQAAIATASGLVVGQTQIMTQPDHAVSQWEQYQSGAWRRPPSPSTSWHLTPMPGGMQLTLRF